jgi:hypothetical protein
VLCRVTLDLKAARRHFVVELTIDAATAGPAGLSLVYLKVGIVYRVGTVQVEGNEWQGTKVCAKKGAEQVCIQKVSHGILGNELADVGGHVIDVKQVTGGKCLMHRLAYNFSKVKTICYIKALRVAKYVFSEVGNAVIDDARLTYKVTSASFTEWRLFCGLV